MKTVLFVPGFLESIDTRNYRGAIRAIERRGYIVKFIQVNWSRTTIDDWVNELDTEYIKHDPANTILAGFSYGSITAFMSAVKRNPYQLWLFSFSPIFSDDMPFMKKTWLKAIGKRRAESFSKLDFNRLAKNIRSKTLLLVGDKEIKKYPMIGHRTEIAHKKIKNSIIVIVPDSDHDVASPNYIRVIAENI